MSELARRTIRSAGNGSGSVEVTLPATFRALEGIICRVVLRDGLRPEIILEPDLSAARTVLQQLSAQLAGATGLEAEPHFSPADLALALFTPPSGASRPPLSYLDALALARDPPHQADIAARVVAALAQVLAPQAGISPDLAADFATATAFALAGVAPDPSRQQACDLAGAELLALGEAPGRALHSAADNAVAAATWAHASPGLHRIAALYRRLSDNPEHRRALDAAWRRGVAIEFSGV